jgi:hypothetical protein
MAMCRRLALLNKRAAAYSIYANDDNSKEARSTLIWYAASQNYWGDHVTDHARSAHRRTSIKSGRCVDLNHSVYSGRLQAFGENG